MNESNELISYTPPKTSIRIENVNGKDWLCVYGIYPNPSVSYDVEMSRIKTIKHVLWWAKHLAGKPQMSAMDIYVLIEVLCDYRKIQLR
jgi:hypothetical protein